QQRGLEFGEAMEFVSARRLTAQVEHGRFAIALETLAALALAPRADCVVVFQREAEGVDAGVATGADGGVAVLVEPLPDGEVLAGDRRQVAGVGWRRGRRGVPERVQNVSRPANRQGPISVGEKRKHTGHPENTAAVLLRLDRDLPKR